MPYINKELSQENLKSRVIYEKQYFYKKIEGFWEFIKFTNKFYIDPAKLDCEHILREEGTRLNKENI